jgi:hypothetical protein
VQVIREFHDLYIASVNVEMGPYAGQSAFYFVQNGLFIRGQYL